MKVSDVIKVIEDAAPLGFQDGFDNSGLQVGSPAAEARRILVTLDITEEVLGEAVRLGCDMIVSHHPLIFHPLRQVGDGSYQQRCVVTAIREGIAIYSSHTSLDNAPGGVNYEIASRLGLRDLRVLDAKDGGCGAGLAGRLPEPCSDSDFLGLLQSVFEVGCLRHSGTTGRLISSVALCGGAGAFLMKKAVEAGADCFVTGEFHYHDFFENCGMLLAELGHYESEQYTVDLLERILKNGLPSAEVCRTSLNTNPIYKLIRK